MEPHVFAAVLFAAALHAGWNALVKKSDDPMVSIAAIGVGAAIPSALVLPFLPAMNPDGWFWLLLSMTVHVLYRVFLVNAYRLGDMALVYPLARGTAPVWTMIVSALWLGETVRPLAIAGLAAVVLGVLVMSLRGAGDLKRASGGAVGYALLTAMTICAYSLSDGIGGRASQEPVTYALWLFLLDGLLMLGLCRVMSGPNVLRAVAGAWKVGLYGALPTLVSYCIAIWAMTRAPIPLVAALRETSVLFALLLAVLFLGEKLSRARVIAAVLILIGAGLLRYS